MADGRAMIDNRELVPEWQQHVDFAGDALIAAMIQGVAYVALKPMADSLGLDWSGQYRRVMRDAVLSLHTVPLTMCANDRKWRKMIALQLEYVPGWLFGITPSRIKPELEQKLTLYRERCFRVLYATLQTSFYGRDLSHFSQIYLESMDGRKSQLDTRAAFAYYRRVAEVVYMQCSRAEKMERPATLTVEQWLHTLEYFDGICAYCRHKPGVVLEHFVPLSSGGGTTFDNCVPSCYSCNTKKGHRHPDSVKEISKERLDRIRTYFALISQGSK